MHFVSIREVIKGKEASFLATVKDRIQEIFQDFRFQEELSEALEEDIAKEPFDTPMYEDSETAEEGELNLLRSIEMSKIVEKFTNSLNDLVQQQLTILEDHQWPTEQSLRDFLLSGDDTDPNME